MKNNIFFIMVLSLLAIGSGGRAKADELWMKNGDHITGNIIRLEVEKLIIDTGYAGHISIDWKPASAMSMMIISKTWMTVIRPDAGDCDLITFFVRAKII